jgi:Rieske Fe-S protein
VFLLGAAGVAAAGTSGCGGDAGPAASAAAPGIDRPAGPLAALSDLRVGRPYPVVTPGGAPLLLVRTGPDTVLGLSARCPHMGCTVRLMGALLVCPCHNSKFAPTTGERISGLAPRSLDAYPVRVVGAEVLPA